MPKVMIISTTYTGSGHTSTAKALIEQLDKMQIETVVVDGFILAGLPGKLIGRSYGISTRYFPIIYKAYFNWVNNHPQTMDRFSIFLISSRLLVAIDEIKPDLIVSVHAAFVGSVLTILERNKISIPFVPVICDLVTFSRLWADERSDFTICPSEEAAATCQSWGVPAEKIRYYGFPVRESFNMGEGCTYETLKTFSGSDVQMGPALSKQTLRFLLMSGGEGSGPLIKIAQILLTNFNCSVTIIAGKNLILQKRLNRSLQRRFSGRVTVHGFVENIHQIMRDSDIAFTRASPNTMMELINCHLPVVITGALPGQEENNPNYFESRNLASCCFRYQDLPNVVRRMLAQDGKLFNQIRQDQARFCCPQSAADITAFLRSFIENQRMSKEG